MKYFNILFIAGAILMTSCSSQFQARNYDDVYFPTDNQQVEKHYIVVKEPQTDINNYTVQPQVQTNNESQVAENYPQEGYNDDTNYATTEDYSIDNNPSSVNIYIGDDYYDYAYSARLRRFHNPYSYNNYYSDYYTNTYWYDYNPYSYGSSIYMGYNFWYPSYSYGWSSWYSPWYSNSWNSPWYYDPYYSYGWGGYGMGYSSGYWNGYSNGYYDGYWGNNYYNSYDYNSNYYGHRGSVGTSGSTRRDNDYASFGERYEARLSSDRTRSTVDGRRNSSGTNTSDTRNGNRGETQTGYARGATTTPDSRTNQENTYTRGTTANPGYRPGAASNEQRSGTAVQDGRTGSVQGNDSRNQSTVNPAVRTQNPDNNLQRPSGSNVQPQRRYQYNAPATRTQTPVEGTRNNTNTQRNTQQYTSPSYNQPRSGQEYTSPKYRSTQPQGAEPSRTVSPSNQPSRNDYNRGNNQPAPRINNAPAQNNERTVTPRTNTNTQPRQSTTQPRQSTTQPQRSTQNNTYQPSRSSESSTPSRSNSSSSQPSRSSESYSAPSRSSSSSSGSSGSSSGSSSSGSSSSGSSSRSSSSGGRR